MSEAARPGSMSDQEAVRLVRRSLLQNEPLNAEQSRAIPCEWLEAYDVAVSAGIEGIIQALDTLALRNSQRAAACRAAWQAAAGEGEYRSAAGGRPIRRFIDSILGSRVFAESVYTREYLVEGILVKGRPCVMGGPIKSLKTSIAIALAVALASGSRFLHRFEVPRRVKVLVLSGESGEAVIQETMRRVCRASGVDPVDLDDFAHWGFELPHLNDPDDLAALGEFLRTQGIEVVIIDPLYLCLLSAGKPIEASNLFQMGPLLRVISQVCLDSGATPILVHHFRKNRDEPEDPPRLEDFAFAGIQEFARQWIMVSRRERFVPGDGIHKLWLAVGGSDGHSGEWKLIVGEGKANPDFADRKWIVEFEEEGGEPFAFVSEESDSGTKLAATRENDETKRATVFRNARRILDFLAEQTGVPQTRTAIKKGTGISGESLKIALTLLRANGCIEPAQATVKKGSGTTTHPGGIRATGEPLESPKSPPIEDYGGAF